MDFGVAHSYNFKIILLKIRSLCSYCKSRYNKKKMPKGIKAGFFDTYLIRIIMSNMEEYVLIQIF